MKYLLRGLALGGACMYLFDPRMGRRRRAILRDKGVHFYRAAQEFQRLTLLPKRLSSSHCPITLVPRQGGLDP